jgi:hypothetical protein
MMKTIIVDKIASVTQACALSHELRVSSEIPCEEGIVLAVEILTNKSQYNTLELTSGLAEVFTNEGTGTMIVADVKALTPAEQHPEGDSKP